MRITFLGGADEVGGSSLLIEIAGRRLLVDAGIRPSPKARWGLGGDQLPHFSLIEQAGGLDAVLVTHAHADHTGALELIAERYPHIPFYATPVTIALARVLHQDSRRIMQTRLDEEGELPLFDDVAVSRLFASFVPVSFLTRLPLGEGLVATFYPAGHIAGAAMLGLHSEEGRILISGDLSISPQRTVDGARPPAFQPDVLILESTYGGRLHANRAVQERLLAKTVAEVLQGAGKVLIPAFALGRAQEVLLTLGEFRRRGELPAAPVWVDGMVRAICQTYTSFAADLPLALQERGAQFYDEVIRPVQSSEQRSAIIWEPGPAVIVSSSGMLSGGPSQAYARALAGKPQHAILLTGYQDEEAPGRRLQEVAQRGGGSIWLGKDKVDVQCRIAAYSLSAHADEGQLLSLAESLDPQEVVLVHGDHPARASLAKALEARTRPTHLPHAGQTLQFHFSLRKLWPSASLGAGRPLSLEALWKQVAAPAGGLFLLAELARLWWGEYTPSQLAELEQALKQDALYFLPDPLRPELYRAASPAQLERARQRREHMPAYRQAVGCWLALRQPGGDPLLACCLALAKDHLQVQSEDDALLQAWPEDVLQVFGPQPPEPQVLQQLSARQFTGAQASMEPNQALAFANQHFPPEARLRRAGYRLEQKLLVLTFDFPLAARQQYQEHIHSLQAATGWQIEIAPETNQEALKSLASSLLPSGWKLLKGPAVYREQQRLALTAAPPDPAADNANDNAAAIQSACQAFQQTSGFELEITLAQPVAAAPPPVYPSAEAGPIAASEPCEINAAYAAIKAALEGSTLYRASLKGDEIQLSFISPQVGGRYQEQIQALSRQLGWKLSINPQPNQGAILEAARALLLAAGWNIQKGPSLYPERGEVAVGLPQPPEEPALHRLQEAVYTQTGYQLVVNAPPPANAPVGAHGMRPDGIRPGTTPPTEHIVEISLALVRLSRRQQSLSLDPVKLSKAVERARRMGRITPPIRVRRLPDSYLLLDGLYRLRAASQLGLERIPAVVE
ncbi:MAG: MBL fold metallo-hydrolase [Chloroflexota bacterium]